MFQEYASAGPAGRPGQQAGCPPLRAEATSDPIYPYAVRVGYHETVRVPMTAAGLRSLRDSLTALLATGTPEEAEDFVADWARAHHAVVRTGSWPQRPAGDIMGG
ncbi:hypothetical protein Asp14428_13610 [Actinoplanes sp. NBRC 14428]|nr:hypothetical protein Asp14428_13610 [Actinoplanes sp. NBRC 14428]